MNLWLLQGDNFLPRTMVSVSWLEMGTEMWLCSFIEKTGTEGTLELGNNRHNLVNPRRGGCSRCRFHNIISTERVFVAFISIIREGSICDRIQKVLSCLGIGVKELSVRGRSIRLISTLISFSLVVFYIRRGASMRLARSCGKAFHPSIDL